MLKNNGKLKKKLTGIFGEIEYSRASLIPADEKSEKLLWDTEGKKSISPLDIALGIDDLPFKITCRMMCTIAKEVVRARSANEACKNIRTRYHINMYPVQAVKITTLIGNIVLADDKRKAAEARLLCQSGKPNTPKKNNTGTTLYLVVYASPIWIVEENGESASAKCLHAIAFSSKDATALSAKSPATPAVSYADAVSIIGTNDDFKYHLYSLAKENGLDSCRDVVILSINEPEILRAIEPVIPEATMILDHQAILDCSKRFAQTVSEDAQSWEDLYSNMEQMINSSNIKPLKELLLRYNAMSLPEEAADFVRLILDNKDFMDYPSYKTYDYYISVADIPGDLIVSIIKRSSLKGRWNIKNACGLLSLKARYESKRWRETEQLVRQKNKCT